MDEHKGFDNYISVNYLRDIYDNHVILSSSTGIDNMSHKILLGIIEEQLSIINRKFNSKSYAFTKYKLKLISKGRGKPPREISIPTIRDKIALRAICDYLKITYDNELRFKLPQDVIKSVKADIESGEYNFFLKLDVANFFPSVQHDKLIEQLCHRIDDDRVLTLISNAIKSPTVIKPSKNDVPNVNGIPQGLSISSILASIYLHTLDNKYKDENDFKYYRYVDDVLIFIKSKEVDEVIKEIVSDFEGLGLKVYDPNSNPEKSSKGVISKDAFGYLGYDFNCGVVSPRIGSVEKLRESLLSIFSGYKYSKLKRLEFLEWRVNLRITGCIFQGKSKGWMCFFSEINNERLLHELDAFVDNLCLRFEVDLKVKSFVRAFFQIKHNRRETKYVPNFDSYSEEEKKYVLEHYFSKNTENLTSREIDYQFKKRISRQVKDIETDLRDAGFSS